MNELTLVNVWQYTTLCDGDVAQKLVQLFVIPDGELEMTRNDTCLLVIARCVAGQLEDFSCQVLEHCCKVYWGTWKRRSDDALDAGRNG